MLPLDLFWERGESYTAREEASCEDGLPFEYFECETSGYGADENEGWVALPKDVLVEVGEAVVPDG